MNYHGRNPLPCLSPAFPKPLLVGTQLSLQQSAQMPSSCEAHFDARPRIMTQN